MSTTIPPRRWLVLVILAGFALIYLASYGWLRWNKTLVHYYGTGSGHHIEINREYGRGTLMMLFFTAEPHEAEAAAKRLERQGHVIATCFWPLRHAEALLHAVTGRGE